MIIEKNSYKFPTRFLQNCRRLAEANTIPRRRSLTQKNKAAKRKSPRERALSFCTSVENVRRPSRLPSRSSRAPRVLRSRPQSTLTYPDPPLRHRPAKGGRGTFAAHGEGETPAQGGKPSAYPPSDSESRSDALAGVQFAAKRT